MDKLEAPSGYVERVAYLYERKPDAWPQCKPVVSIERWSEWEMLSEYWTETPLFRKALSTTPAQNGDVERVTLAIYNAPDSQSGDYVGTVIYSSEHLFVDVRENETSAEATKRTAMQVCRDAARAALSAIPDARAAGVREGLEMAAKVAYVTCAQTRHVTLGDKVADAIRALKDSHPTPDAV